MFSDGSRGVMQLRVVLPHATEPLVCLNKSIVGLPRCLVSSGFNHLILQNGTESTVGLHPGRLNKYFAGI